MNAYVYQRTVRTLARFRIRKEIECVRVGVTLADVERARREIDRRLDFLNVTDSRITSVAMRERIRTGRQS